MNSATRTKASLTFEVFASFLLVGLLWAGCAIRSYPGPVHGIIFDGTAQAIDVQSRRLIMVPLQPSQPVAFGYEDTTKFWKNGIPIHPDEVEPGRSLRVHYRMKSGQPVAYHVYVQVPYAPEHWKADLIPVEGVTKFKTRNAKNWAILKF
jgi:hypothetical protein